MTDDVNAETIADRKKSSVTIRRFRKGEVVSADHLNELVDAIEQLREPRVGDVTRERNAGLTPID